MLMEDPSLADLITKESHQCDKDLDKIEVVVRLSITDIHTPYVYSHFFVCFWMHTECRVLL